MRTTNDKIDIAEILTACSGSGGIEEGKKVFLKYFDPKNKKLDINKPIDGQGKWTALAFTTYFGKAEHVFQLLKMGAKPGVELDKKMNVLHMAATEGRDLLCVYFLKSGVDVNSTCDRGMTALMKACEGGHLDVVKALMPFNPDIMKSDKEGKTCIDYCKESNSIPIVRYINSYYLNKVLPQKSVDEMPVKKVSKI